MSTGPYKCPYLGCNSAFKCKKSLAQHIKYIHNFDESQRLHCPYTRCNQTFKRKGDLNVHIRYQHDNLPRHKCPYQDCHETFQRITGLNQHIDLVHQGLRPHVCKHCGKTFKRIPDLRNHLEKGLCWSLRLTDHRDELVEEHDEAVIELRNFLKETKNPKSHQKEVKLPNRKKMDLLVRCPDNRRVGFDVTIGRTRTDNLRYQICQKFHKGYEKYCDIVYIFVISKIKYARSVIRECDKNTLKPKKIRVVHWNAIIQNHPKYYTIFQRIENETAL